MNEFAVKKRKKVPLCEQATILTYDVELEEWNFFTDNPTHARKWEHHVKPSFTYPSWKAYDATTGELIGLEGTIIGRVSLSKPDKLNRRNGGIKKC